MGGGRDTADNEEYAAEGDQEHEDHDEERCAQNDGCAEEWTEEGGYADDHAEHAWGSRYAEWNAEEDEYEGKDDYGEYVDGRWARDGNRYGEDDDDDSGQQIRGESAACIPGHLAEEGSRGWGT